jgi:hypothetical protein
MLLLLLLLLLKNKVVNYALSDVVCRLYQSVLYFENVTQFYSTWIDDILFKPTVMGHVTLICLFR